MARFTIISSDNKETTFDHPCFAWVGTPKTKDAVAIIIHAGNSSIGKKDNQLFVDSVNNSGFLNKSGFTAEVHDNGIKINVDTSVPAFVFFTTLKLVGKVYSYREQNCRALIKGLKEGLTLAAANVYSNRSIQMGYNYPVKSYDDANKLAFYKFLTENEIQWGELESRCNGDWWNKNMVLPQREYPVYGASCPDYVIGYANNDRYGYYGKYPVDVTSVEQMNSLISKLESEVSNGKE